jgi:hypothetical protein
MIKQLIITLLLVASPAALAAPADLTDEEIKEANALCSEHYHTVPSIYAKRGYEPGWESKCEPILEEFFKRQTAAQPQAKKDRASRLNELTDKLKK